MRDARNSIGRRRARALGAGRQRASNTTAGLSKTRRWSRRSSAPRCRLRQRPATFGRAAPLPVLDADLGWRRARPGSPASASTPTTSASGRAACRGSTSSTPRRSARRSRSRFRGFFGRCASPAARATCVDAVRLAGGPLARGDRRRRPPGTVGEAGLLHFRGAYHNPAMALPVTMPPVAAGLLGAAALKPAPALGSGARRGSWRPPPLGVAGVGFHPSASPGTWAASRNLEPEPAERPAPAGAAELPRPRAVGLAALALHGGER